MWQNGLMVPGQSDPSIAQEHYKCLDTFKRRLLYGPRFRALGHGYLECNHEEHAINNKKITIGVQLFGCGAFWATRQAWQVHRMRVKNTILHWKLRRTITQNQRFLKEWQGLTSFVWDKQNSTREKMMEQTLNPKCCRSSQCTSGIPKLCEKCNRR
jgi:hypothetical protein